MQPTSDQVVRTKFCQQLVQLTEDSALQKAPQLMTDVQTALAALKTEATVATVAVKLRHQISMAYVQDKTLPASLLALYHWLDSLISTGQIDANAVRQASFNSGTGLAEVANPFAHFQD